MRPHLIRRLFLRQYAKKPVRTFTHNSSALYYRSRPQLPFLSIPSRQQPFRHQQWRYLTTERRSWLRREAFLTFKFTAYIWAVIFFLATARFAVGQDSLEAEFPTPHEWSFWTRMLKRGADAERWRNDVIMENWPMIMDMLKDVLRRLEDPAKDGKGVKDLVGPGKPPGAKDISDLPEAWRRGYYEALLLYCIASEHVQGFVLDKKRKMVFPAEMIRGPSNPFPKPIPVGSKPPPREEDCVPADFPTPDECYLKLLATEGLNTKQRMDAALSYANWLEYKGVLGPAAIIYDDALNMALAELEIPEEAEVAAAPPLLDPKTNVLNDKATRSPSANLLTSLTALATFKARHEDVSSALPILISILQARRSLPKYGPSSQSSSSSSSFTTSDRSKTLPQKIMALLTPPDYPPPPPDGRSPPVRDSKELCEEAGLHLHIGEILYAMQSSTREDGLVWTREGVDLAEEELHKVLEENSEDRGTKATCRECLGSGLDTWATMVRRMVREEEAAKASGKPKSSAGWFGLWSGGKVEEDNVGRWSAEEKVVSERRRRVDEMLEDLPKPPSGLLGALLRA